MENYTEIWMKLEQIRMEIEDLDDDYLMEEVLYLNYQECPDVIDIVNNYMKTGGFDREERRRLEGYYTLVWLDEDAEE